MCFTSNKLFILFSVQRNISAADEEGGDYREKNNVVST